MKRLFFDTETTGFFSKTKPLNDPAQPHLVQLAAILDDEDGNEMSCINFIIHPYGFTIPVQASNIHGITDTIAEDYGVDRDVAVTAFADLVVKADILVAHNIDFDDMIMQIAYMRSGVQWEQKKQFCTMKTSTDICRIPGKRGNKWPKMMEAYQILVDPDGFENAHDALADVRACKAVYYKLRERGVA